METRSGERPAEAEGDTPRHGWARSLDRIRWLGPGLVVAATAIGASHLVLAPTAGAAFGYALLWVIPLSHLFKYPAFEFGPRWAVATGTSLLDGYVRIPGPPKWALWAFLAGTVVQGVTVLAGVLGVAAAVVAAALPALPIPAGSLLLGVVIALLLRSGGFDGLSALSKWMLLVLGLMTVTAFVARPPPAGDFWSGLAVPAAPSASLVLLAALLGWMPTGIDVAVWHSMWALERREDWRERARERARARAGRDRGRLRRDRPGREGAGDAAERDRARDARPSDAERTMAVGLLDMRLGYGLSLVLGVLFLSLGAEVLRPAGLVPEGADVAITLARLYTEVLGPWVLPVFLLAAFFGMFSTAFAVLDGFPRAFTETAARLRGRSASRAHYWGFLTGSLVLAVAETALLPDPVVLVTVAAVISFLLSSLLYAFNHYCVTRLIPDPALRPRRWIRVWSGVGIACMAAATGLFLYLRIPG